MKILKSLLVCLALLSPAYAQDSSENLKSSAAEKKFFDYIDKVKGEIKSFSDKLDKNELCSNHDLKCLDDEVSKIEVKSSTHASLYFPVISSFLFKAKKAKPKCDKLCASEFLLKMLDLQTKLHIKLDIKKLHTYDNFISGDIDFKNLQMMEELSFYNLFQLSSNKIFPLLAKIDYKSLTPELKNTYAEIVNRTSSLEEGYWLLGGAIATLNLEDTKGADYQLFLSLPNAKDAQALELLKKELLIAKIKNQIKR